MLQDAPKKKVKVTRVVDGHEVEEWVEVDAALLAWPPRSELRLLDHDLPRVDGPEKVSGRARYTHDVRLPGMLYARLLCCPHPSAKVEIDVAPALVVDGVVGAIVIEGERTLWLGQPVAAVAAQTPDLAEDGLRRIYAVFEELPWAVTPAQALAEGAPPIGTDGNRRPGESKGDRVQAEAALARADLVVEATYTLPFQHHASLETHGVVVDYRGGDEATLYASTQYVYGLAEEAARELGLPASRVRAVCEHMGGGFGAKFGLGAEGKAACRLAKELGRPIHLMLTRQDEFLMAGNRSASQQRLKGGASKDGRLVALVAEVERLGGIGRGSSPGQPYIYQVETAYSETASIHTNTDASRAMRAPGHPQASFAIESLVDELAYGLGLDPLEMRKRNLASDVHRRQLDQVADLIGWRDHPHRTAPGEPEGARCIGIGFAVSTWGGGGAPRCEVEVEILPDGSVTASVGSQDLGTGTRTYVAAIAAEELGLPLSGVTARIGDSRLGPANPSGGSTTAASLAPAVKDAAVNARQLFAARIAPTLGIPEERVRFSDGRVSDAEHPDRGLAWKQACLALPAGGIRARGVFRASLASQGVHGAQAAKVEVDPLTGAVQVLEMVCVQDCGLPLNRLALRSQIQGGMIQSLSYGLLEERVLDPDLGFALNANLEDYKVAGTLEIPAIVAIVDEDPRGVIGVGEPPIIPGQSAIANAVFNACGARVRDLPLSPDKVLRALGLV